MPKNKDMLLRLERVERVISRLLKHYDRLKIQQEYENLLAQERIKFIELTKQKEEDLLDTSMKGYE